MFHHDTPCQCLVENALWSIMNSQFLVKVQTKSKCPVSLDSRCRTTASSEAPPHDSPFESLACPLRLTAASRARRGVSRSSPLAAAGRRRVVGRRARSTVPVTFDTGTYGIGFRFSIRECVDFDTRYHDAACGRHTAHRDSLRSQAPQQKATLYLPSFNDAS